MQVLMIIMSWEETSLSLFYGAADEGMVTMKHVMKAVHRELTKGRNVALTGNYGKYSYLLV